MIRKNKKTLWVTSLIILLPLLTGLLLWGRLPEKMPIHWNFSGEVDGWSGKTFGVCFLPLFLLGAHWFIVGCMCLDPRSANISGKSLAISLWLMPVFSNGMSSFVYASALGVGPDVKVFLGVGFGVLFLILGNWLPKCRPNYTVGIRLPWTLASDEVWTKTHRLAGKIWMAGGAVLLLTAFLGGFWWVLLLVLAVDIAAPTVYAIVLSRR